MNAGDVVDISFPFSSKEPKPYKERPVAVVAVVGSGADETIWCVMISSSAARVAHPTKTDVLLTDWSLAGLDQMCVVRTRRVWTGQSRDIVRRRGRLEDSVLRDIRARLMVIIDPMYKPLA